MHDPAARIIAITDSAAAIALDAGDGGLATVAAECARGARRLVNSEVTIVFAGHFSVGKSTMLNSLCRTSVLPTHALPETGVPCVLRRAQAEDSMTAEVVWRDGIHEAIEPNAASVARFVCLHSEDGMVNEMVERVDRLELYVPGLLSGRSARWIDSPGLSAGGEGERALEIAAEADLLVWVLRSGQFLAENELATILDHVARCGPDAVALALNVWLEPGDPSARWAEFQATKLRLHVNRLRSRLAESSQAPQGWQPPLVACCALAAAREPERFGLPALQILLSKHSAPDLPPVRRLRARRARHHLRRLLERLRSAQAEAEAEERTASRNAVTAAEAAETAVVTARRRFRSRLHIHAERFCDAMATLCERSAQRVADEIGGGDIPDGASAAAQLITVTNTAVEPLVETFCQGLREEAVAVGLAPPPDWLVAAVTQAVSLAPPSLTGMRAERPKTFNMDQAAHVMHAAHAVGFAPLGPIAVVFGLLGHRLDKRLYAERREEMIAGLHTAGRSLRDAARAAAGPLAAALRGAADQLPSAQAPLIEGGPLRSAALAALIASVRELTVELDVAAR